MSDVECCILLTGCTAGLGLALLERLVDRNPNFHYITICRNEQKALTNFAGIHAKLKKSEGKLDIVIGDHAQLNTMFAAAKQVKELTNRLDCVYLNAGTMGKCELDWKKMFIGFCQFQWLQILSDAPKFLKYYDDKTSDGYERRFQINCFSHFILVNEIAAILKPSTLIVWTSSATGKPTVCNLEDLQCVHGVDPYGSSKWCVNLAAREANDKLNVKSVIADPGTFQSEGITGQLISLWIFTLYSYFLCLLRPILPELCLTALNSTESFVQLFDQRNKVKPSATKFCSYTNFWGEPYVEMKTIESTDIDQDILWSALSKMYENEKKVHSKFDQMESST